jgi:UPF0042 nucleotide-binding protein
VATPEYLVIITGLSGSGKSYVQSTLEDLGFYCCDNLPIHLIEPFLEEVGSDEKATRVGIVVDVRTHDFASVFPNFYRERIQKLVKNVVLIFLEANDEVLARRYSETRRPHPMSAELPILEAIQAERSALTEVKSLANLVLDTSQFSVHELKAEVMRRFGLGDYAPSLLVTLITFGFKYSLPYNLALPEPGRRNGAGLFRRWRGPDESRSAEAVIPLHALRSDRRHRSALRLRRGRFDPRRL